MNAKDKFQEGQRVRMTEEAIAQHLQGTSNRRSGVVKGFPSTGFGDIPRLVYIVRDGTRTKVSYHMKFWEACDDE